MSYKNESDAKLISYYNQLNFNSNEYVRITRIFFFYSFTFNLFLIDKV